MAIIPKYRALMKLRNIAAGVFFTIWASVNGIAAAAPAPLNVVAAYQFTWNGIPFGSCRFEASEDAEGFSMRSDVRSSGVARVLVPHQSVSTVTGKGAPSVAAARSFSSEYNTRGKEKSARVAYGENGVLESAEITPPEAEGKRPPIPAGKLNRSADFLTLIAQLRLELSRAMDEGSGTFSIPLFDGKRLYTIRFHVEGEESLQTESGPVPVIRLTAWREAAGGLTEKERKKLEDEPSLTIYIRNDAELLPLRLSLSRWGTMEARRVE